MCIRDRRGPQLRERVCQRRRRQLRLPSRSSAGPASTTVRTGAPCAGLRSMATAHAVASRPVER
eukprot:4762867-Alexandrium_andersonii.AAC.1